MSWMKETKYMKRKLILLVMIMAVACWAGTAGATTTYVLSLENSGALYPNNPAPFGEVTVDLTNSTTASVTFTTLAPAPLSAYNDANDISPSYTFANEIGASVNGNFSVSDIHAYDEDMGPAGSPTWNQTPNSNNFDGFGFFNLEIDIANPGQSDVDIVTFNLNNTSGSGWNSDADVFVPNSTNGDYYVAAHMVADFDNGSDIGNTFYASTPLPGAFLLLGAGLVRLAAYGRKKRKIAA
jgi:hypothetical protein